MPAPLNFESSYGPAMYSPAILILYFNFHKMLYVSDGTGYTPGVGSWTHGDSLVSEIVVRQKVDDGCLSISRISADERTCTTSTACKK